MGNSTNAEAVDRLLAAIEQGQMADCDAFAADAVLDATVPNWRFGVKGGRAITEELARWYATPGVLEEVRRLSTPAGEAVTFTLRWEEDGVPHAAHQAHLLSLADGVIARDEVWCGGRWPASVLAEMAAAAQDIN